MTGIRKTHIEIGSVAWRVALWFSANSEEALTGPDISTKFNVRLGDTSTLLKTLVEFGVLARKQQRMGNTSRVYHYQAGPWLRAFAKDPTIAPPGKETPTTLAGDRGNQGGVMSSTTALNDRTV